VNDQPRDPAFEARVRASFAKQTFMATLGATLVRVEPGAVDIALPYHESLAQQHGFVHAGALATIADSACGYAALTLMKPGSAVLSVEFKINMLAPAAGKSFLATGRVIRSGRTLTVCSGEVRSTDGDGKLIAVMQATMMAIENREGLSD
jgi:uncharacterized protein (TIGR00369 family)